MTGNPALALAWRSYRGWAARSRELREQIDRSRRQVLWLTVAAAALATLAGHPPGNSPPELSHVLNGISAVCLALATFTGRTLLDPAKERQWFRARALAEACKSASFRFAAGVPPYDGAAGSAALLERVRALTDFAADVAPKEVDAAEAERNRPPLPLDIDGYLKLRLDDQVERFYRPKAARNEQLAASCAAWVQRMGAAGAVLGTIGAIQGTGGAAAWVPVTAAVASAVGAYALSERFERLAATYQATAMRLSLERTRWELARSGGEARSADEALIMTAEDVMAAENGAWLADMMRHARAGAAREKQMAAEPLLLPAPGKDTGKRQRK